VLYFFILLTFNVPAFVPSESVKSISKCSK